jgi:hypothetical protein
MQEEGYLTDGGDGRRGSGLTEFEEGGALEVGRSRSRAAEADDAAEGAGRMESGRRWCGGEQG